MKVLKPLILTFLTLALVIVGAFSITYYMKTHRNTETLGRVETEYTADEHGERIIDIPFDEYISDMEKPKNAVVPKISQNMSGEENSEAINKAISSLKSGGIVYIPSGEYKVSTVFLKSGVTLWISRGAKLISLSCDENEKSVSPLTESVIYAESADDIVITGGGTVNGNGVSYTNEAEETEPLYALKEFNLYTRVTQARKRIRFSKDTQRNNVIKLKNCKNVKVDNIVLEESAEWTFVLDSCDNVSIENIVIDNNMRVANSDGIDICGSKNVFVKNCFIATGDDAIVLKSNDGEIENVEVENCILSSFANCFKIGTETQYNVKNVSVKNCKFFLPSGITGGYAGIAIESADGAEIESVDIDNIEMNGISSPILIWLGNRLKYDKKEVGSINNISISNIDAVNTEFPSAITGCESDGEIYSVENIKLKNINAVYRDTDENLKVRKSVDDTSMNGYPEITRVSHYYFISHEMSGYWDLPCYSLFLRNAVNADHDGYHTVSRSCSKLDEVYKENVN